jgi:dihydroorotate dehydrogenase electron transfer subunit
MSQEGLPTVSKLAVPDTEPSRVIFNRAVGPEWYVLRLEEPTIARTSKPGQFVQILCSELGSVDPLLRRPFSVYDVDQDAGTYDILYMVTGRGTRWMSLLSGEGQATNVDVIGPFGNRLTAPESKDTVILVAGGVGVAPMYFFARELCAQATFPEQVILCMGARGTKQLQGIDDFRTLPIRCEVSTNDGSEGFSGFVTDLLADLIDGDLASVDASRLKIYGCGPTGMNDSLRRLTVERSLTCEICLEARMACGFGICFACVVPIRKDVDGPLYNRRICLEGCVFDARLLGEGLGEIPIGEVFEGPVSPE